MVITITMKNAILRSGKYHFRMRVPKDCLESVGKKEITQSLKTTEAVEAVRLSVAGGVGLGAFTATKAIAGVVKGRRRLVQGNNLMGEEQSRMECKLLEDRRTS